METVIDILSVFLMGSVFGAFMMLLFLIMTGDLSRVHRGTWMGAPGKLSRGILHCGGKFD